MDLVVNLQEVLCVLVILSEEERLIWNGNLMVG